MSFRPYLLELDLQGCIDSTRPRAWVKEGVLTVKATKKEGHTGAWGSLGSCVDRKCNPDVKIRRDNSIKEKLKYEEEVSLSTPHRRK